MRCCVVMVREQWDINDPVFPSASLDLHGLHAQGAPAAVNAGEEAVDEAIQVVEEDRRVASGFLGASLPPLNAFLKHGGPALMLELVLASPGERCDPLNGIGTYPHRCS